MVGSGRIIRRPIGGEKELLHQVVDAQNYRNSAIIKEEETKTEERGIEDKDIARRKE